jgi:hypothetical protein
MTLASVKEHDERSETWTRHSTSTEHSDVASTVERSEYDQSDERSEVQHTKYERSEYILIKRGTSDGERTLALFNERSEYQCSVSVANK